MERHLSQVVAILVLGSLAFAARPVLAEIFEHSGGHGRPISIVLRDAPLSEVFEMLSRKEQVNILLGKGVEGSVSVNLFEVSLDNAIRAISDAAGYVAERRRGTYVIIDRDEAGKDSAAANTVIRAFKIEYSDPELVSEITQKHLSRYGRVTVLEPRRLLIVEDLPDFVGRIEQLLREIDREPRQILIQAKILEITLDEDESFGIDWARTFNVEDGSGTIGVEDFAFPGAGGLFFDLLTSDTELVITALDEQGRVRTLSTPSLLSLEHQEAEVVIGDRLGFRVTTTINQVTTESVEFLESGVILRFTASVDQLGRIVLQIHPEVSTGTISDGLPNQTTTEVTTTLVTQSGQRVFIAGLIKDRETQNRKGIPFVSQVPVLGRLFTSTQSILVNTETVVILTASIVGDDTRPITEEMTDKTLSAEEQLRGVKQGLERRFLPGLRPDPAAKRDDDSPLPTEEPHVEPEVDPSAAAPAATP